MNGLFVGIGAGPGMGVSTAARFAHEGFDLVLLRETYPNWSSVRKKFGKKPAVSWKLSLWTRQISGAVQQLSERFG